jgi:NAD(P)-dependent dehydrogenase (short-subunit alcohol dehydrogenase family)
MVNTMNEESIGRKSTRVKDKVIVITGASDGIGAAAARLLKAQGAQVVIVGRSSQKTKKIADLINAPYYLADFTRLDDVRKLASELKKDFSRIDVLANNAGGVMGERTLTADGHEMTVQVNHLAPFLLTNLLLDRLIASRASVIATASFAHRTAGKLNLDDFESEHGYKRTKAYGKAKLMNILFTRELHKRYHDRGISAAAFHPGTVRTSFSSEFGGSWNIIYGSFLKRFLIDPSKGADTMVWLATTDPGRDWQSGEYYHKRKVARASKQSYDSKLANDLWELSAKMTTVK